MKFKYFALWLSLICVLMFILQLAISGFTDALVLNQSSYLQPWRFVTSIFLHGSPLHLIYNLFALLLFGLILEKIIGSNKFLLVFFISGIVANLVSINFYSSSLGASGAIYGVLGALTVLRPKMVVWVYSLPMPMFMAAIVWIIAGIFGAMAVSFNVAHIAHLSGIVVGFLLGLWFRNRYSERSYEARYKIELPENQMRQWEDRYLGR